MTPQEFENVFQDTMMELEKLVGVKGGQYASTKNRLHNFDRASSLLDCPPWQAARGFWMKQFVSLLDELDNAVPTWTQERCDEVVNDLLVYFILTKAILYRAKGWKPKSITLPNPCVVSAHCFYCNKRTTAKEKDYTACSECGVTY